MVVINCPMAAPEEVAPFTPALVLALQSSLTTGLGLVVVARGRENIDTITTIINVMQD